MVDKDKSVLTLLPSIDALIKHGFPERLRSSFRVNTWLCGPNASIVDEPGYRSNGQSLPCCPVGRAPGNCGLMG